MNEDARERFMKLIRNRNKPVGFTAKDIENAAAEMERDGRGVMHVTFSDGTEADIPIKDALMAYWGFEDNKEVPNA